MPVSALMSIFCIVIYFIFFIFLLRRNQVIPAAAADCAVACIVIT